MVSRCLATAMIVFIVMNSDYERAYRALKGLLTRLGILPGGDERPVRNLLPCDSWGLLERSDGHLDVDCPSVVAEGTSYCCLASSPPTTR